ncbi:sec-independent protein translocase protein TatB [Rhodococcus rhodochrous J38]|jgi:sec-independent protein translocase protein TatB|uniref:Sec-independent protein translocase subunit TatA/TatB n=1 Tax=Rhodococcus rhodochrous TaxID=1829 RepID=UPI0011A19332|nr:preprotein translocase [Rhodococcus rhodochrous]TWH41161.1 sec-independent protein translocase protein TatB [Rhodococcus rhodochrous J38]
MFGLTLEKLFLVAVLAGIVIGPQRLTGYAHHLAGAVRSLRDFIDKTRSDAERDIGISLHPQEWESLDLRQYDPRRIVSDALHEATAVPPSPTATIVTDEMIDQARHVRFGQKYLITGTAAHPRRILIEALAHDDPRRIAAETRDSPQTDNTVQRG